ncbi:MAG: DUF4870 domain-containing protein [Cryomorphaceae bacterium]|nr:DUF4870 domain-containing protein [Cryomorphaceae bacterium]
MISAPDLLRPEPSSISSERRQEAANSYVLTLMAVMVGLPFPILNLFACLGYWAYAKKKSVFVRFHALQAVLTQAFVILANTIAIGWALRIIFLSDYYWTREFFVYLIFAGCINLIDTILNIVAATKAQKGELFFFIFFGRLSYHLTFGKELAQVNEMAGVEKESTQISD